MATEQQMAAKVMNLWDDLGEYLKDDAPGDNTEAQRRKRQLFGEAYMGLARNVFDIARVAREG